ncbi:MAG TPA: magnesium/cobalt transporter CorA [Hyphomicrobiaceae bacterium]|nr:magnesium/cobalt transporter CorA [Hyphomicrobiaceae bacterium]
MNHLKKRVRLAQLGRRAKPGAMPGQVTPAADAAKPTVSVFAYGTDKVVELPSAELDDIKALRSKHKVIWIDVSATGDAALILALGEMFGLHRLALEDVVNTHQRPKAENYDDHTFLIARMLNLASPAGTEQVAFFLGQDFLLTFQSIPGDCFEPVRQRIRNGRGRIRSASADYLCYALIDTIVDSYFPELERVGEVLEELEDAVVSNPDRAHVEALHDIKRELLMLRRSVWPHREMLNTLVRDDHALITRDTQVFLRDCYDHTIQLMDIVETYREIATGLMDLYISSVSTKLNEIMKVLTIIATIFMPLTFISGLYGMNFDRTASAWNMPELGWKFGYLFALGLMIFSTAGLLWYFYRNGWMKRD